MLPTPPLMTRRCWLHRHTGFTAGKLVALERRHRVLEQEAA